MPSVIILTIGRTKLSVIIVIIGRTRLSVRVYVLELLTVRYSLFSAKQTVPVRARRILRHAAEHQVRAGSQPLRQLRYATVARGCSQKIQVIPVEFRARLPYNFSTTRAIPPVRYEC